MSTATATSSSLVLDDERALTPAEAAAFLGVSIKTLANWRSLGKGPAYLKYASDSLDNLGRRRGSVAYLIEDLRPFRNAARTVTGGQR